MKILCLTKDIKENPLFNKGLIKDTKENPYLCWLCMWFELTENKNLFRTEFGNGERGE